MPTDDVPDSTDWLSTPLAVLSAVEAALRCQVCKDFFQTPVITTCSHTFCSLCIRRAISSDGKCPLCRAPEQELRLRSNWSLEETVEAFVKARPATLELARNHEAVAQASKRKAEEEPLDLDAQPEAKRIRKSARLSKQRPEPDAPIVSQQHEHVIQASDDDNDDDEEFVPEPEDGLVACPICQKRMKEWQVFSHLESCTGDSTPQPATITTETNVETVLGQSQRQQQKLLERLPALNYSLLKEQLLRKKLAELGISNQGPRPLLERRHKEWMTLWNANCDAAKPKKRNELLRDLDVWERTQGGRAQMSGKSAQNAAIIKDKDFDGAAWAARHESSFKDLVASARQSRSAAAKKKAEDQQASPGDETPQQEQNAHPETTAEAGSSGEVKTETEASPNLIPKTTDGNTAPDAASIPPSNSNDTNLTGADLRGLEKHDVDIKPDVLTPMLCD